MAEPQKKDPKKDEDDPFYVPDVDDSPPPAEFEKPKWLERMKPQPVKEGAVELKSASSGGTPPPLVPPSRQVARPANADVRADRPVPKPTDPMLIDALSRAAEEASVRIHRPTPAVEDPLRHLQPIDESSVEIVQKPASRPSPARSVARTEGAFDVVVDAHAKSPVSERLKVTKPRKAIGIVDTTFARFNMGEAAIDELRKLGGEYDLVRRTVPGIKDLAVECKILFEEEDCDLVIACGMVGGQPIDKQCAHEASLAIQWCMLSVNRHILEVFVHEDEAQDEHQLATLMDRRTRKHAENAHHMLLSPERLVEKAGQGLRQGFDDAGPVRKG